MGYYDVNPEYLGSKVWKEKRSEVFERSKGICECEGDCSNKVYIVHHKSYPKELGTENIDTLQGLCGLCHEARHERLNHSEFNTCCRRAYI